MQRLLRGSEPLKCHRVAKKRRDRGGARNFESAHRLSRRSLDNHKSIFIVRRFVMTPTTPPLSAGGTKQSDSASPPQSCTDRARPQRSQSMTSACRSVSDVAQRSRPRSPIRGTIRPGISAGPHPVHPSPLRRGPRSNGLGFGRNLQPIGRLTGADSRRPGGFAVTAGRRWTPPFVGYLSSSRRRDVKFDPGPSRGGHPAI
jgi:hypothetical protein